MAPPIFVTQRSASWKRQDGQILGISNVEPGFRQQLVDRFGPMNGIDIYVVERQIADAILAGCEATQSHCLDLMEDVDFDLNEDFYDELHTTASGAKRIGAYLHSALKAMPDF